MKLGAEVEAKSQRLQDKEKVCGCKTQPPVVQFAVPSLSLHSVPLAGPRLGAATEFPFPWSQERGPWGKTERRGHAGPTGCLLRSKWPLGPRCQSVC